jgi:hypothetical protein
MFCLSSKEHGDGQVDGDGFRDFPESPAAGPLVANIPRKPDKLAARFSRRQPDTALVLASGSDQLSSASRYTPRACLEAATSSHWLLCNLPRDVLLGS